MIDSLESRQFLSATLSADAAAAPAFDPGFTGGVFVAAGNVSGDRTPADLVIAGAHVGAGGGPHIKVFDGTRVTPGTPTFRGGITVAAGDVNGDVNGDGTPDVIVAAGPGGGAHVK